MIPAVNFVYPLFTNDDILAAAGVTTQPATRTEFAEAAAKVTNPDANVYGWVLPLNQEAPNGIQNDVMSWAWASGESMLKDGQPDVTNAAVTEVVEYVKKLYDDGVVAPGAFSKKEPDKVEEFTNGRAAMMIDSLAHVTQIREANPDLHFSIGAVPAKDGYTGERGMPYASWGLGVAANSKHQAEAWKLAQFLLSKDTNSKLSSIANAFPNNKQAKPDYVDSDPVFAAAFDIWNAGYPANEFVGLPVSEDLMRTFDEQLQLVLDGKKDVESALADAQKAWVAEF
jgi:multiple sugar transport system substrate-binding protein